MSRLTPKQRLFVEHYLVHYNASRAVKETYGDNPHPRGNDRWEAFEESARARGHRLFTNVHVSEAIRAGQKRIRQKFEFDEDMVVAELAAIVFTHLDHLMPWDADGPRLLPSEDLPDFRKGAVKGMRFRRTVEVQQGAEGTKEERVLKVEHVELVMQDRVSAIKLLLQHGGWLPRGLRVNVEKGGTVHVDSRQQSLVGVFSRLSDEELKDIALQVAMAGNGDD